MSECNDGVVLTNDPDHPMVQCQRCGELEAENAKLEEKYDKLSKSVGRNVDWVEIDGERVYTSYDTKLKATIAEAENELNAAEATIASFAAVDAARREENAELEATISELEALIAEKRAKGIGLIGVAELAALLEKKV